MAVNPIMNAKYDEEEMKKYVSELLNQEKQSQQPTQPTPLMTEIQPAPDSATQAYQDIKKGSFDKDFIENQVQQGKTVEEAGQNLEATQQPAVDSNAAFKTDFMENQAAQGQTPRSSEQNWEAVNQPAVTPTVAGNQDFQRDFMINQIGEQDIPQPVAQDNWAGVNTRSRVSPYIHPYNQMEADLKLPMGYLRTVSEIESRGDNNARSPYSSALGEWQITQKTAEALGYKWEDMTNPELANEAMLKLTKQHQQRFTERYGREPTGEELYLMHQQGQPNAFKIFDLNPDANAVSVLGRDEVLNNGGNVNQTVSEYKRMWGDKYNNINKNIQGTNVEEVGYSPYGPDVKLGTHQVSNGTKNELQIARDAATPDANGIRTIRADMGLSPTTPYKYHNYDTSDSSALWQSLVTAGIAMLGAKWLGADDDEVAEVFLTAGANQFTGLLNRSSRYKNIKALQEQGYDDASIEQWINSGDRSDLKERKVTPWQRQPDGTYMRTLPNGDTQFMGDPDPEVFYEDYSKPDEEGMQLVTAYDKYFKPLYTTRKYVEINKRIQRSGSGATNSKAVHFMSPDGRQFKEVYRQGNTYVDRYGEPADIPADWDMVPDRAITQQIKLNAQQKEGVMEQASQYVKHQNSIGKLLAKHRDPKTGRFPTEYKANTGDKVKDLAINKVVNGPWWMFGGGEGEVPVFGDKLTGAMGVEVRDLFTDGTTLRGNVRNAAITAARAAGAVGINTQAEVKNYEESIPKLDYSSFENYQRSQEKIAQWYEDEMKALDMRLRAEGYTLEDLLSGKYYSDEGTQTKAPSDPAQSVRVPEGQYVSPALSGEEENEWIDLGNGVRYRKK